MIWGQAGQPAMGKNYQIHLDGEVKLTHSNVTHYNTSELCSTSLRGYRLIRTSRRGGSAVRLLLFDADKSALHGVFVRDSS